MRILLVTDWLREQGGCETYFGALRAGLRAAGDDVRLLTSTAGSAADGSADYRAYGTERRAAQAFLQIANPFAVARVAAAVRGFRPELVFVGMVEQHLSPAILAGVGDLPTVINILDYKPICPVHTKLLPDGELCTVEQGAVCWRNGCVGLPHWLRDRPRYALLRSALRRADRLLACSEWLRRALAASGIQADALMPTTLGPSAGYRHRPAADPHFVFVGRLSREKGVASLLRAFVHVRASEPSARLRVVGDGAERVYLQRLAVQLGLGESVSFAGWLTPTGVEQELASAWALVTPSLWAEPFGLVAVEALIRGVPVVASATGGLAETVEHGTTGLLFPNGDEQALGRCLEEIATRRAFPSVGLAPGPARAASDRHSLALHIERVREICADVVARRHRRAAPA
jgi:glycosyltransferase involved in cell wall biosynthesis